MPDEQQGIIGQVKKWVETWFLRRTGPQYFDGNLTLSGTLTMNGNVTIDDAAVLNVERINAFDGTGLSLYDDGNNLGLAVADGGNVGIGTAAPTSRFNVAGLIHVTGSGTPSSGIGLELEWDGTRSDLLSYSRDGATYQPLRLRGSTLSFLIGTATAIAVDSSGNVGINEESPGAKLDTEGSATTTIPIAVFRQTGVTADSSALAANTLKSVAVHGDGGAYMTQRDVTNDIETIIGTSSTGVGFAGTLTNHPLSLRTNNTERVRIDTSGNAGIGVTSPKGILDVWDGTSGHMIVTKTAVDSTPVEVLPNATGGMAEGAHVRSVVVRSGVSEMNSVSISPGATGVDIFNDATNVWQLQSPAAASKQLLVVRSAGTGTANITLDIIWQ